MYLVVMQNKRDKKYIGSMTVEGKDIYSALKRARNEKIRQLINISGLSKKEAKTIVSKIRFGASFIEGISEDFNKYLF